MATAAFHPARSGVNFDPETGKLYRFEPRRIEVLRSWPDLMAWRKTAALPVWAHCRPRVHVHAGDLDNRWYHLLGMADENGQLRLPLDLPENRSAHPGKLATCQWQMRIPREVRAAVHPFRDRHWHLLQLTARCGPAALDLVRGNPALAYALASNWVFHRPAVQRPLRSARARLRRGRKQREVQEWLGFPATKAGRKVLAKVVPAAISVRSLLYLRDAMRDPVRMKALGHLPRLNRGVLRLATDPEMLRLVTPTLLEEVALDARQDRTARTAALVRDTIGMWRQLFPDGRHWTPVSDSRYLRDLHDGLVEQVNNLAQLRATDIHFPPPPVPGTDSIVPITDAVDLLAEGVVQHNCVAAYASMVAHQRQTYVYRVLWPERCTLSLVRSGGNWQMGELRRMCNASPSRQAVDHVRQWLSRGRQE